MSDDRAFPLKRHQRTSDRVATDREPLGQLPFRRKPISRLPSRRRDALLNKTTYLFGRLARAATNVSVRFIDEQHGCNLRPNPKPNSTSPCQGNQCKLPNDAHISVHGLTRPLERRLMAPNGSGMVPARSEAR